MSCHLKHALSLLCIVIFAISEINAVFEGCDHTYNISAGYSYLRSPYHPNQYPAGTSCRYTFNAPQDYSIDIDCTLNLPQSGTSCSTDFFYLSTDGDRQLRGSEQFCGAGSFKRKSLFRTAVLAYISNGGQGSFSCTLYTQPQPCDCGWYSNTRIVSGVQAYSNEYPSMAYLAMKETVRRLMCGATIISHYHVMTAAHCVLAVTDRSGLVVVVGDHDRSSNTESPYTAEHGVYDMVMHPYYQQDPDRHDIAIIITTTPIEWSRGVGPICLPPDASNLFTYTYVDLPGWGTQFLSGPTSSKLLKVTLMVSDNQDCQAQYPDTTIFSDQLCTYDYTGNRKDTCQLDSGGPAIRRLGRQFVVGIVSFGDSCGKTAYATGVNTRVSSYLPWIKKQTGYTTCNVNM